MRLTSVGPEDGPRNGSLKIVDTPPPCEPCEPVCTPFTMDFEEFGAGSIVGQINLGAGLTATVAGERNGSGPQNDAMIFDADNPTGGDTDLAAGSGKVLIITENNNSANPDDAAQGGTFVFTFSEAVNLDSVNVIDTEEGGQIRAYDAGGALIGSLVLPDLADGALRLLDLSSLDDVTKLEVTFDGSGALDDLKLEVCRPDPNCDCLL